MVSLDDAVIARLKKGDHHFEILVDPYSAADLIEGKDVDVNKILAVDSVFKDSRKGTQASEESIQEVFGTTDLESVATKIILKGDIQLTTDQRHKMQENKRKRIVEHIAKNAMDPKTKAPHPRARIERAIEEAGIHVDPFKPVRDQVESTIDAIRAIIPISTEHVRISVKIPPEYTGKAYGMVRKFGRLEREDWQSDGSWIGIIDIPAGMQTDLYDRLNDITKGNVSTKILK